jgi:hypothetical protein
MVDSSRIRASYIYISFEIIMPKNRTFKLCRKNSGVLWMCGKNCKCKCAFMAGILQTLDISFFGGYYIISPITAKKVIYNNLSYITAKKR